MFTSSLNDLALSHYRWLNGEPLKYAHDRVPEAHGCHRIWIKVFEDVSILKVRILRWDDPVRAKSNDKCPYKRHKKVRHTQEEEEVMGKLIGVMASIAKEHLAPPEAERGEEAFFPTAFRGSMTLLTRLNFTLWPVELREQILLFQPSNFVVVCYHNHSKLIYPCTRICSQVLTPYSNRGYS